MAFIFMTKEEVRRQQKETRTVVRILDDVDWVYGPKARVRRHERSAWAQKVLSGDTLQASGARPPKWIESQIEALPRGATLCFNLCACHMENVPRGTVTFEGILKEFGKRQRGVAFSELVRSYIKKKFNNKQSDAANAAHLDPQVVNQIYNDMYHHGGKKRGVSQRTVIALGLAFELTLVEVTEFMRSAGYAFSDSDDDRLLKLCFKNKFYEISKIDAQLQAMQAKGLGSKFRGV